ncbi:MAG: radical SAM protein [Deltaproteobacteria bacterium]|nr:radical SAM protein [Deltaproteobacteria bacterium]
MSGQPVGTITLEVTYRCHRRCAFCYVPALATPDATSAQELPARELARLAAAVVRATGCKHVQLSGGEPLLRADLLPLIDGLAKAGARTSIITDGAHLDASLASSLAERQVAAVQPTLLSGSAELHDSLRGPGAFREATRAIATAAAAGLKVSVCMVVTRLNYQEAERVAELCFALGARGLALSRFCPAGRAAAAAGALMPDAAQVRAAAQAAASACRSLGLPLAAAVTIPRCVWSDPDRPPIRVGVCSLVGPKSTVTIGPDGAVRSCSLSTKTVGSLASEPWETLCRRLWDGELGALRASTPEPCRDCPQLARCLGGCRLSALAMFADASRPDPLAPVACAGDV